MKTIPRRIFAPARDEITEGWKESNEEPHSACCSSNIIRMSEERGMRWAGHVARAGEMRN